ncbi:MAG: subtype A tannase [Olegusella sp.]|nr:subtype A tannase [Olegusella sp.]
MPRTTARTIDRASARTIANKNIDAAGYTTANASAGATDHGNTATLALTRRGFLAGMTGVAGLGLAACAQTTAASDGSGSAEGSGATAATGTNPSDLSPLTLDDAAWSYDADNDIYYQIGVQYCASPAATAYESLGVYVPGGYFDATDNGDGTYTCAVREGATVGSFTSANAPVVMPVNTAGYSAQEAPASYSAQGLTDYTAAGMVYVYAGCRGRSNGTNDDGSTFAGGAPWGVTDLKAAVRCLRYNAAKLPGGATNVFTFGHSGGGAQSALMGATGDAPLYTPYLESIGAVFTDDAGKTISDALTGAMCWCPITSLDAADEAYEWMMGQFASSGTRAEGTWTRALSADLATAYADYINGLGLTDEDGSVLELAEGGEGTYTSGSYYEKVRQTIEDSLNHFLSDTTFPYTPSSQTMADGGFGGGAAGGAPSGEMPSGEAPSGDISSSDPSVAATGEAPGGEMPSGDAGGSAPAGAMPSSSSDSTGSTTYETVDDYIASLNADEDWVTYDAATNTATVSGMGAFVRACKQATKDVGAFDALDRGQAENYVFGTSQADALHFDATMADLLQTNGDTYAAYSDYDSSYADAYAQDLESVDDLGTTSPVRQDMYNPLYFLCDAFGGYGTAAPAAHWRIRTGIEQGDTSLTIELNLALALAACGDVADVDFATVWSQGHTTAERTGSAGENFRAWVEQCCA